MLGSNEIGYVAGSKIAAEMDTFIDALKKVVPNSEIIILAITGVTAEHEKTKIENMANINEYNSLLKKLAQEKNHGFIDVCSVLLDSTGYLSAQYAEKDGLHLKSGAFKVMLNHIQNQLIQ